MSKIECHLMNMVCFKKSRIEIRVKLPKGLLLSSAAFMTSFEDGCQQGERNGQMDIAKFYNKNDKIISQSTIYYGKENQQDGQQLKINSSDWIEFGIEWNNKYLQTFLNRKVVYHANAVHSQWGKIIRASKSRSHLPFDHAFNLLIHIGVRSFLFGDKITSDNLKLLWNDEFNGITLNESLWTVLAYQNKCESKVL